ncbi:MAG TPA: hypothetical protein RMH99_06925, partial [Sandaracinaceae bacterium LLY-WYZ-13_1]|nr:hypothetical protein [Sandaracinaceae bacterium LLY-WYZ-13_1]
AARAVELAPTDGLAKTMGVMAEQVGLVGLFVVAFGLTVFWLRHRRLAAFLTLAVGFNLLTQFLFDFDPLNPDVGHSEQVLEDLMTASKHIPKERLGATDDCGFSPFSTDETRRPNTPRPTSRATSRSRRS